VDAVKLQEQTLMFTTFELFPLPFKPIIDDFAKDAFLPNGDNKK
jgi:hypothetical protein